MGFDFSKEPGKVLLNRGLNAKGTPLVSIITAYYNAWKYFEQTYNCVMNQTFPWFEWIIVNDGSTNQEDVTMLEQLVANDNRIKVLHKENGGSASARNMGIKYSNTEIIIPLDTDDLIQPNFIEYLYWGLCFHSDAAWCYTDSVGFGAQEYVWQRQFSSSIMKVNNILVCTAAIKKQALLSVGGYPEEEHTFHEDWALWLLMLQKGYYPVHLSSAGFWYRKNDNSRRVMVQRNKELEKKSEAIIKQLAEDIDEEVKAVEYPRASRTDQFIKPQMSSFDRKVFREHDKINVMMLIPWMVMGGADLFNLDVVKRIDKERFEISILSTVAGDSIWRQRFEEYVTDIFELPTFLDIENYAEFISYFIKTREIDVIFLTNSYYGYYLVPWLRKHFPDVAIIDYVHMEEWYWRNGGYARTSGVMGGILEKTYVCNERTRRVLINDFGREPESVETLYIGTDHEKYNADTVEPGQIRKVLGIEEGRKIVLFPCRMHPQKRPFLMLEIAEWVKKQIANIAFVAVGDGPQLEELKQTMAAKRLSDTVYFAGRAENMLPYYKDADVTLICSLKEGLALTAYESLSMGVPVISSDVGGQKELIDDAVGGIIPLYQDEETELDAREFSEEEVQAYVAAVVALLQDEEKYARMSVMCRRRIEEGFSSDIMIRKLENIFTSYAQDESMKDMRREKSKAIWQLGDWAEDYVTAYQEVENRANVFAYQYNTDTKSELMRIANSKWGRRAIKLLFKLKLNKIFLSEKTKKTKKLENLVEPTTHNPGLVNQGVRKGICLVASLTGEGKTYERLTRWEREIDKWGLKLAVKKHILGRNKRKS